MLIKASIAATEKIPSFCKTSGLRQERAVWLPNDVWMRARVQTERRRLRRSRICQARAQDGVDLYYLQNMCDMCSSFRHCSSCDTGLGLDSTSCGFCCRLHGCVPSTGDVMVDSLARSQHQHNIWCLDRHRTANRLRLAFIVTMAYENCAVCTGFSFVTIRRRVPCSGCHMRHHVPAAQVHQSCILRVLYAGRVQVSELHNLSMSQRRSHQTRPNTWRPSVG
jgi:hypothetical protein